MTHPSDELLAKVQGDKVHRIAEAMKVERLKVMAPFPGMEREWTDAEKQGLNDALMAYGWK